MATFNLFKSDDDGQFYFNLEMEGLKLASEGYKAKHDARNGMQSVVANAPKDDRYERRMSGDAKFYFVLKAGNGEVIAKSTQYRDTEAERDKDIQKVRSEAPLATVEEE